MCPKFSARLAAQAGLVLCLFVPICASSTAAAQVAPGDPGAGSAGVTTRVPVPASQQAIARLQRAFNLSTMQLAEILPLLEQLQSELSTLSASGVSRSNGSQSRRVFLDATASHIRALLTPIQQQRFDAMRPNSIAVMLSH